MDDQTKGYHGHMTMADGSHIPLSADEAQRLWDESERRQKERAERLPDERTALNTMFDAFDRLKELGWREAMYCPKDGSHFQIIEPGSTGIFDAWYDGKWPTGSWWCADESDIYPSHPILFRLYPEDEAKYQEKMAKLKAAFSTSEAGGNSDTVKDGA